MEPLEISTDKDETLDEKPFKDDDEEDDDDDVILSSLFPPSLYSKTQNHQDDDLDEILNLPVEMKESVSNATKTARRSSNSNRKTCGIIMCKGPTKIGNDIVLNTYIYNKTKKCIVGPHWFGLIFTSSLLGFASYHFIQKASHIGYITHMTCIAFTILASSTLLLVGLSDPGIVMSVQNMNTIVTQSDVTQKGQYQNLSQQEGEEQGWRYCATCDVYQPPKAAHCPDCNLCIDGYDHHCPWMGTCIGKNNLKPFVLFNMTWLVYLLYAGIWVSIIGPSTVVHKG
jgi:hypothetical protein